MRTITSNGGFRVAGRYVQFGTLTATPLYGTNGRMNRQSARIVFLPLLALASLTIDQSASWAGQAGKKPDAPAKAQKARSDSMTGCVDEQEGRYVLVDARTMSPVAALEADGFPTEGFAKHVGHKVTVRGISSPDGALPHFKVRSIEAISDTCSPQPEQGKP